MDQMSAYISKGYNNPNMFVYRQEIKLPVPTRVSQLHGDLLTKAYAVAQSPELEIAETSIQINQFEAFACDPHNPSGYTSSTHRSIKLVQRDDPNQVDGRISSYIYEFNDGSRLTTSYHYELK